MRMPYTTKTILTIAGGIVAATVLALLVMTLRNADTVSSLQASVEYNPDVTADIILEPAAGEVKITKGGEHTLTGTMTNGQILIDAGDADVMLVLNGVSISNSSGAAIYVKSAGDVTIALAPNSTNVLTQAGVDSKEEQAGAIYSTSDVQLTGADGAMLTVNGSVLDGIVSKDDLVIENMHLAVVADDDGIRGKDSVTLRDSDITIDAGGDGITTTNKEDTDKGWIALADSTLTLTTGGDGIVGVTDVTTSGSTIAITAGGGSAHTYSEDTSKKGIKSDGVLTIASGSITIDSADDSLHAATSITLQGGTLNLASGDDGVHADGTITISGGNLTITKAYEGIEAQDITVSGGVISMTTSDDGFNISGGSDGSATLTSGRPGAGFGGPGGGQVIDGLLLISGGEIHVNAQGDGLDSNGGMYITGGTTYVDGPTRDDNGALDVNGEFTISGGVLLAVGSSGMAEAPDNTSSQYSILVNLTGEQAAGTEVRIVDATTGATLTTYTPSKTYRSVVFSSPELQQGSSYTLYLGDSLYTTFTLTDITTQEGQGGMMGGGGPGGTGGIPPMR